MTVCVHFTGRSNFSSTATRRTNGRHRIIFKKKEYPHPFPPSGHRFAGGRRGRPRSGTAAPMAVIPQAPTATPPPYKLTSTPTPHPLAAAHPPTPTSASASAAMQMQAATTTTAARRLAPKPQPQANRCRPSSVSVVAAGRSRRRSARSSLRASASLDQEVKERASPAGER